MEKMRGMITEFMSPESNLFIYSLSFGFLLSLAPSLIIFAMMFKWGTFLDINVVIDLLRGLHLSGELQEMIEAVFAEFMGKSYGFVPAITTLCVSFWLASRSVYSFLLISSNHEKVDVMKFSIRIQSIAMFIVFVAMMIGGVLFATIIYDVVDVSLLPPMAAVIMVPVFTMMYRALSFRKRNLTFGLVGGLFTTTCIILLCYLSFILINQLIRYNKIYGSLASLVALLLVIYILSAIIYLGFLLNLVMEENYGKEEELPLKHAKYYQICEKLYYKLPFTKKLKHM